MEENTGIMDGLSDLIQNFDLANFIPELDSVLGWVSFLSKLAILAPALLLLGLGIAYFFFPTKEANRYFGYRTFWGMGSPEAWRYTQKLAGAGFTVIGLVLSIIMLIVCGGFTPQDPMAMVSTAGTCLMWQLVLTALVCLAVNLLALLRFDRKGNVRPNAKINIPQAFFDFPKWRTKKAAAPRRTPRRAAPLPDAPLADAPLADAPLADAPLADAPQDNAQ